MFDVKQMLAEQAEWQKARRLIPWPEKLRMAAEMRETLLTFQAIRAAEARRRAQTEPRGGITKG